MRALRESGLVVMWELVYTAAQAPCWLGPTLLGAGLLLGGWAVRGWPS